MPAVGTALARVRVPIILLPLLVMLPSKHARRAADERPYEAATGAAMRALWLLAPIVMLL